MNNSKANSDAKQIDISRAPLGVKTASALVEAVAASDDRVERHYLEIKSDLNLTQKNDIAKIAKFILGAANRLPRIANTAFEGYGVMVIGVAPGDARGVPPVEVLELEKIISQYIGVSGPKWDVVRVPTSTTNEVLVVHVAPPQDGEDPFVCRKDGDNLYNGRVYIRADGETREAKAEELDLLLRRGKFQAAPDVSFSVEIVGTVYPINIDDSRTVEEFLTRTKRRLLEALPQPQAEIVEEGRTKSSGLSAVDVGRSYMSTAAQAFVNQSTLGSSLFRTEPENRTEEQYRASIERWEQRVRDEWGNVPDNIAGDIFDGIFVRVSNASKIFFHDLEVKIHLEGDVRGTGWNDASEPDTESLGLPAEPRVWGPVSRSILSPAILNSSHLMGVQNLSSAYESPLDWKNSGSVDLTLDVGELRPRQTYSSDEDELVLFLPHVGEGDVSGTWEITARDHNDIYAGDLTVPIGPLIDLTARLRKLLDLE